MSHCRINSVPLGSLLEVPPQNGYSPICSDAPTGKWVLGLAALDGYGLDLAGAKPAPLDDPLVDRFQLKPGDFLISRSNTLDKVGRVGVFDGGLDNCTFPDLMMRFRPDPKKISPEYLEAFLRSEGVTKFIQQHATGTSGSMKKINQRVVESIPVLLPPPTQQLEIASLLSTWYSAIEKAERLIIAKQQRKAGVMTALLTEKKRLNGFHAPWRHWHLGELFRERAEANREDLPLLSITADGGVVPRADLDRKDTSSEDKSNYLRICQGDIGYNTMRMWQGVSGLSRYEGIVSPAYTVCIPGPDIDGRFASYLFKLPAVIHLFYRYSQGLTSDTWNLKFHHFAEIKIHIPEVDEQIAIASVLAAVDQELAILKKQREALALQKRGLMQKLLTSQRRARAEDEVPA